MKPTNAKMKSRLFQAVIAGGFALAVPLAVTACSSDATDTGASAGPDGSTLTPAPGNSAPNGEDDGGGNGHQGDASHADAAKADAGHKDAQSDAGDAGMVHDADPDADGGWPPTK